MNLGTNLAQWLIYDCNNKQDVKALEFKDFFYEDNMWDLSIKVWWGGKISKIYKIGWYH